MALIEREFSLAALNNYHNHLLSPLLEVLLSKPVRILAFWSRNAEKKTEREWCSGGRSGEQSGRRRGL